MRLMNANFRIYYSPEVMLECNFTTFGKVLGAARHDITAVRAFLAYRLFVNRCLPLYIMRSSQPGFILYICILLLFKELYPFGLLYTLVVVCPVQNFSYNTLTSSLTYELLHGQQFSHHWNRHSLAEMLEDSLRPCFFQLH